MKYSSSEQLLKSLERRVKHLMIDTLNKFEAYFPDMESTRQGQLFKDNIKNTFNDAMRAQRDELRDYTVEYRPLRLTDDNLLSMTQTYIQSVQKVEFGIQNKPFVKFYVQADKAKVLDSLRLEVSAGVLYNNGNSVVFEIVGIDSCVNHAIPLLDKYRLHDSVKIKYNEWRAKVVELYRS